MVLILIMAAAGVASLCVCNLSNAQGLSHKDLQQNV